MKIAFFLGEFPVLSETFVIRQITGLVEAGHDVRIIAAKIRDLNLPHEKYLSLHLAELIYPLRHPTDGRASQIVSLARFVLTSLWSARGWKALRSAARAATTGCRAAVMDIAAQSKFGSVGKFDAIIAHFGQVGVRAMFLQRAGLIDGPIATVFHGFDMSEKELVKRNLPNYERLFADTALMLPISALWRAKLVQWGAAADKVRILRMGVDVERLAMQDPARPLKEPLKVLSVARFTEKKGLQYAVEGVRQAASTVAYSIIGSGPLEDDLRALAANASPSTIEFAGKQPHQRVFEALEQADIFLLPSVTAANGDMEGVPVVLMEAMAKGVLVLATRHSGIPELVEDGVSGMLVEERDDAAIARALDEIASGRVDIRSMRIAARHKVESMFDNAALDRELIDIASSLQHHEHQ